jgi:cell division protein ZapA (FtsZ GTPase activity inhibitor)
MLTAFVTTMQSEHTKLASNLEAKLNKLAENLDAKLDTKLKLVTDSLNANLISMIANVTAEMRKENYRVRQEFSTQLQT